MVRVTCNISVADLAELREHLCRGLPVTLPDSAVVGFAVHLGVGAARAQRREEARGKGGAK